MQYLFSCTPETQNALERTLSAARLSRYLPAAKGDRYQALRLYIWNVRLCEAFYLPCQIAEVSIRNSISGVLAKHFKSERWYAKGSFRGLLPDRLIGELDSIITEKSREHGSQLTHDHIIAGLSFGFWSHTLTRNFEKAGIWPASIQLAFPNAPRGTDRNAAYWKINEIRSFRNRIAHHYAVFDKAPSAMHAKLIEVISWSCQDTAWLVKHLSRVSQTINSRPQV